MDLENWPINRQESNGISSKWSEEALLSDQNGKPNADHDPKHSNYQQTLPPLSQFTVIEKTDDINIRRYDH